MLNMAMKFLSFTRLYMSEYLLPPYEEIGS